MAVGLSLSGYAAHSLFKSTEAQAGIKIFKDLQIRSSAGTANNLLASELMAGLPVEKLITEGNHTHKIMVTADLIAKINAGETVQFPSEDGSDGSGPHRVTINPATLVNGGNSIEAFESEGADILGARLGKGETPFLYVAGQNLKPDSIRYCIGDDACQKDESLLLPMEIYTGVDGKQIFSSKKKITFKDSDLIHIFAETVNGDIAKIIAKISK